MSEEPEAPDQEPQKEKVPRDPKFELKDVLAILSAVGEIYAFTADHSAKILIAVGVLASLFGVIWALLERKNPRTLVKTLSCFFLIVGSLSFGFFIVVGVVVGFGKRPLPDGHKGNRKALQFDVKGTGTTGEIEGSYTLQFLDGDHVIVTLMPADESRLLIKEMRVIRVRDVSQGQSGRLIVLNDAAKEIAYELSSPSKSYSATLDLKLALNQPTAEPTAKVLVTYDYSEKTLSWRTSKWIFDHFGE